MINRLQQWLPVIVIVIVAVVFRFPYLDSIPPGLNFDEGGEGVAALDVTQGHFRIWWPIGGGKEPLMAYLVQPLFWILGPTRLALRVYTALMGVGAVLGTYFLAQQLFFSLKNKADTFLVLDWLPIFAALGLATAFWHVAYSRIAFRALSNPTVEAFALGFLWLALRTGRWRDFCWAGFFIGGLIYTYLAGRFVPVAITLFFIAEALIAWRQKQQPLLLRYWQKLIAMVGVAILVFAPVGLFFAQNPSAFVERAGSVSIFSPAMNQGDFWSTLWHTTLTTLGTFVSLTGDPNLLANIPGQPELNPLLAVFFLIGVIFIIVQSIKNFFTPPSLKKNETTHHPPSTIHYQPYLFLLIWWPIMLLPGILAPEDAPHHLRLIGTAPATYILIALGLSQTISFIANKQSLIGGQAVTYKRRSMVGGYLGWLFAIVIFGFTGFQTYHNYFNRWNTEIDHYMAFDVYAEELAKHMATETDSTLAYAIPMDLRAAHEARHYSLDFLYQGQVPFGYVVVDEQTVAQSLTNIAHNKNTLKVVRWIQDKHNQADAREVVSFLLETGGATLTTVDTYPVYAIESYQLSSTQSKFGLPPIEVPIDVTLDGLFQIRRAVVLPELTPGGYVATAVTFAPIAPIAVDYKASVRLFDSNGAMVAQKDRYLTHNWHQRSSLWPREEVNEYYLLPLPSDFLSGVYEVRLVVYHPETLAPLTDNGLVEVVLGQIVLK